MASNLDIVVIGGGAAGFFGAITCANVYPEAKLTILEATKKPLNKVRISGGGRCNVTHNCFDTTHLVQNYPRGGKALRGAFTRFQPQDTITWFEDRGVKLKAEANGRMFPVTDNSETIVNCLLDEAKKAQIALRTSTVVKSVRKTGKGFEIGLKTGKILYCDRLLIATGSNPQGLKIAKNLGHKIISTVPSLFTFNITDPRLKDLAGICANRVTVKLNISCEVQHPRSNTASRAHHIYTRARCYPSLSTSSSSVDSGSSIRIKDNITKNKAYSKDTLQKLEQTGPLLITHWGVSGPAILKLSAWGARVLFENKYQMELIINWVPEYNSETLREYLLKIQIKTPKKKLVNYSPLPIPKRLWQNLVSNVVSNNDKPWAELSKKELNKLVQELIKGSYKITGKGVFKDEFVTCGGVSLKEINFKTMASKICPGLYFAGEVLDIDGVTGGFNFQNAWTTGWLAGKAMGD